MAHKIHVLGIDIAKLVFHVVGRDNTGHVVLRKRLARRAGPAELATPLRPPHMPSRPAAVAWPLRLARFSRWMHKWVGTVLALIMVALSVTGTFVAFKNELEYLQPAQRSGVKGDLAEVIPPVRVAEIILALQLPEAPTVKEINRIELRPSKRMYKVRLEQSTAWRSPRELQVDATTGAILNDGVRGDQLWMDLHSFAVFGEATKLLTMTVSGIALLWLCLSGYYLFFYPLWFRAGKRRTLTAQSRAGVSRLGPQTDGHKPA